MAGVKSPLDHAALPRLCITAGASGSGKTTFTCGLLGALIRRGLKPAAFKCGPDYIDPMFHREVIGAPSTNLDLFFFDEAIMKNLIHENARNRDIAVLEGAMGFYDGQGGSSTVGSAWHIAEAAETPVILIENCAAVSVTAAARIKGMAVFREPTRIKGVVLNNCSETLYHEIKTVIQDETGIAVLGYMPRLKDCVIESRHLGLVTAAEIRGLKEKLNALARAIEANVDLDALIAIAQSAPPLSPGKDVCGPPAPGAESGPMAPGAESGPMAPGTEFKSGLPAPGAIRIGVARDEAFCFYYPDNLRLLEKLGAELVEFSPLRDTALPADLGGLYLGGGYPELYGKILSENTAMLAAIRDAIESGMPCVAECGGFMYLHETLADAEGRVYPMAAVIRGGCRKTSRLVRFGYASYIAAGDNLLCSAGDVIRGHEFHYWESDDPGGGFTARKPVSGKEWPCIQATATLCAGYPHFHFYSNPGAARRFVEKAARYAQKGNSSPA